MQTRHTEHMGVQVRAILSLNESDAAFTGTCTDISALGCFIITSAVIDLSSEIFISLLDDETGNDIEISGVVVRIADDGIGVRVIEPTPSEWGALGERTVAKHRVDFSSSMQMKVLVAKQEAPTGGERAFYESSGWDVCFAASTVEASSILDTVDLTAVIAEFPVGDIRWRDILKEAQSRCPGARRILRTTLARTEATPNAFAADALITLSTIPQTRASLSEDPLIHQLTQLSGGLEDLMDALTSSFGMD